MEIWQILTIVFGILAAFFGIYWNKAKTAIEEIGILFEIVSEALADDTLTKEELVAIVNQVKKILDTFKKTGKIDALLKEDLLKKLKK